MDLNIFEIIQGPVVSSKATLLNQKSKKLIVKVHPHANKMQIKAAFKVVFNVEVEKVNTLTREGKNRRVPRSRRIVQGSTIKRAIVTLKEGYSIDLFGQSEKHSVLPKEE